MKSNFLISEGSGTLLVVLCKDNTEFLGHMQMSKNLFHFLSKPNQKCPRSFGSGCISLDSDTENKFWSIGTDSVDTVPHPSEENRPIQRKEQLRGGPLMIWGGGARVKAGKKNSTATRPGKKPQLNNPEEKKNSTVGWMGKKKLNANSLPEGPPRSLMVRPKKEDMIF